MEWRSANGRKASTISRIRQHHDDVASAHLAHVVTQLSQERETARLCALALEAVVELTDADGGEVVRLTDAGTPELAARSGTHAPGVPAQVVALTASGAQIGALRVWGEQVETDQDPAVIVIVAQLAQALATERLGRRVVVQRARARRLAKAVRVLREIDAADRGLGRLLDVSCTLAGGIGAVLVSGIDDEARIIAGTGLDPVAEQTLAGLVARDLVRLCSEGRPWAGALPTDSPLRSTGVRGIGLVVVRSDPERTATLAILTEHPSGLDPDDMEALQSLIDHATATLGAASMRGRIAALATVDPVTRLFNDRYFATRLDQETHRAIRSQESLSLIVLGIEGWVDLRRDVGDEAANTFLARLVDSIVGGLRATDVGCRIADDELGLILPASGGLDAFRIAERIRNDCRTGGLLPEGVGLSAGVASFPEQAAKSDQLARFARAALGLARRHAGNRTFLFDREVAAMIDDQDLRAQQANESLLETLVGVASAIDDRHPTTHGHARNVAHIGALLAQELGMPVDRIEEVRLAGLLHDVGKIGVTDELISRPGPLTDAEWVEMRQHPDIGYRMLSGANLGDVRVYVRFHHERMDGQGYPNGLIGDQIPMESRIISVANALDTMINDRPYRIAIPFRDAIREIVSYSGTQFCPDVVAALERIIARDPSALIIDADAGGAPPGR
jgi:diguanylate cyclase (GGDEF)-like protein